MLTRNPEGSRIVRCGALVDFERFVGNRVTRRQLKQQCKVARVITQATTSALVAIGVVQVRVTMRSAAEKVTLAIHVLKGAV